MDWYLAAKLLHVVFAIIWLGGGMCLLILAVMAERTRNDAELVRIVQNVIWMSQMVFIPTALLTVLFGVVAVYLGRSFTELWVLAGLAGFAWTFLIGVAVIKPRAERLVARIAKEGVTPSTVDDARQMIQIAKFDFVLLFLIVALMVLKPTAGDVGILTVMAAIVALAAFLFYRPQRRTGVVPG
jgi:uncharacterized membrane protein